MDELIESMNPVLHLSGSALALLAEKENQIRRQDETITRQAAEIERLRAALNTIACASYKIYDIPVTGHELIKFVRVEVVRQLCDKSREALEGCG